MGLKITLGNVLAFFLVAVFVLSCSSEPTTRTVSSHDSPAKALENLQRDFQKAKDQELFLLSPSHYQKAMEFTERSRQLFQKGATMQELFASIDKAENELALAFETANLSRSQLKDTMERRAIAKEVLAQSERKAIAGFDKLKEDFEEGEGELKDLTKAIENGEAEWARGHQEDSLAIYNRIIATGSHRTSLDEVERVIQQATAEGSRKLVPKTHSETLKKLDQASKLIAHDPRDTAKVQKITESIHFQARRLLELTRAAKEFSNREPEEAVLWLESRLHSIGVLVTSDTRDRRFDDQVTNIHKGIDYMKKTGRTFEGEKRKLQSDVQGLQAELAVKGKVYALEQKVTQLRSLLTSDEADIFRDGKLVTIRLKNLRFPKGQAGLSSDNFPVLERVQRGIAIFGTPKVTVEGHTDSQGGSIPNQRLSLERARSVKGYLLSGGKISNSQVSIAGLGFNKPLTSNKTELGRATNRRIDVILEVD